MDKGGGTGVAAEQNDGPKQWLIHLDINRPDIPHQRPATLRVVEGIFLPPGTYRVSLDRTPAGAWSATTTRPGQGWNTTLFVCASWGEGFTRLQLGPTGVHENREAAHRAFNAEPRIFSLAQVSNVLIHPIYDGRNDQGELTVRIVKQG